MTDDTPLEMAAGDRCTGSGQFAPEEERCETAGVWTGLCPVCGRRLKRGYAGAPPEHRVAPGGIGHA